MFVNWAIDTIKNKFRYRKFCKDEIVFVSKKGHEHKWLYFYFFDSRW